MNASTPAQDWLPVGIAALNSFLESNPNAEQRIREIIDKRLGSSGPGSWQAVFISLENYMGKEATDVLDYVLQTQAGQIEILQEIGKSGSSKTMSLLRTMVSLYGTELEQAYLALKQLQNTYKAFNREVSYDFVNKRYQIRMRLEKYNGEMPLIEGDSDAILDLTNFMIQTLLFVDTREAFKDNLIEQFIEQADKLIKFLRPPEANMPGDKPKDKDK